MGEREEGVLVIVVVGGSGGTRLVGRGRFDLLCTIRGLFLFSQFWLNLEVPCTTAAPIPTPHPPPRSDMVYTCASIFPCTCMHIHMCAHMCMYPPPHHTHTCKMCTHSPHTHVGPSSQQRGAAVVCLCHRWHAAWCT